MKLIIDIPNYKLDEVQNGSIASGEILKAVRAGTPYNPTGDLISREALKEAICKAGIKGYEEYNQGLATALDLIDLAPTVAYPFYQEAYQTGYEEGRNDFERPQGEWIYFDKDEPTKVECPFCHNRKCCIGNYCDYCGADMRGCDKE